MRRCFLVVSILAFALPLLSTIMSPHVASQVRADDPTVEEAYKYLQEGGLLNADQLLKLDARLQADAKNLPDRLRQIGYFQGQAGFGGMISDGPGGKALVGLVEYLRPSSLPLI